MAYIMDFVFALETYQYFGDVFSCQCEHAPTPTLARLWAHKPGDVCVCSTQLSQARLPDTESQSRWSKVTFSPPLGRKEQALAVEAYKNIVQERCTSLRTHVSKAAAKDFSNQTQKHIQALHNLNIDIFNAEKKLLQDGYCATFDLDSAWVTRPDKTVEMQWELVRRKDGTYKDLKLASLATAHCLWLMEANKLSECVGWWPKNNINVEPNLL